MLKVRGAEIAPECWFVGRESERTLIAIDCAAIFFLRVVHRADVVEGFGVRFVDLQRMFVTFLGERELAEVVPRDADLVPYHGRVLRASFVYGDCVAEHSAGHEQVAAFFRR